MSEPRHSAFFGESEPVAADDCALEAILSTVNGSDVPVASWVRALGCIARLLATAEELESGLGKTIPASTSEWFN